MRMKNTGGLRYRVKLNLFAAGPISKKTKNKEPIQLSAKGAITLPFIPFPGLYLTMEKPKRRGMPLALYLRVRAVEWDLNAECSVCTVDDVLAASSFDELYEIRGSPMIQEHFDEAQKKLKAFGFEVETGRNLTTWGLDKNVDGSPIEPICRWRATYSEAPRRRWGW